jgi:hypothetical protein
MLLCSVYGQINHLLSPPAFSGFYSKSTSMKQGLNRRANTGHQPRNRQCPNTAEEKRAPGPVLGRTTPSKQNFIEWLLPCPDRELNVDPNVSFITTLQRHVTANDPAMEVLLVAGMCAGREGWGFFPERRVFNIVASIISLSILQLVVCVGDVSLPYGLSRTSASASRSLRGVELPSSTRYMNHTFVTNIWV